MNRMNTLIRTTLLAGLGLAGTAAPLGAATLPSVASANLTYRLSADTGLTSGGEGTTITAWTEQVHGVNVNIQTTPTFRGTAIAGGPAVRFDGGASGGDLIFSNNAAILNTSAQTIFVVASMASDAFTLSDLISDSSGNNTIRQTTTETAAYFTGNSADFALGGTFAINGSQVFAIPGGFGTAQVVKAVATTTRNINSLRIGNNANNRLWAGDVAEVLVYDGVLNGNDTAAVNRYLTAKYALTQVDDEKLADAARVADNPFASTAGTRINYGVNFLYSGPGVSTTFHGIGFDNVNMSSLPAGPIALSANANNAGATVSLIGTGFTSDNTVRTQTTAITGTDGATLDAVANQMFYMGATHTGMAINFAGLAADTKFYVQLIGGDAGWNGDLSITVNGVTLAPLWAGVADGVTTTASLFGFDARTNALGQLNISLALAAGNFAGVSGILLSTVIPAPAALPAGLALMGLFAFKRRR
ncbi:MAG: hypothetical protein GC162_10795 [Planctomycetes bacterium]|nr:hypothetical protein [Planctomycetota bacterium]